MAASDGKTVEYLVDSAGNRIGKKVGGVLQRGWLWDGSVPAAELDASSAVTTQFIHGADGSTPSYLIQGARTYRVLSDERGSVRFVIDVADGSIAQQLDYDEFGRVLLDTAPGFQPFGFAGGLYDPDTGLVRFGLRDYSPETGQWTDRDPILFGAGQFSLYAYVNNDPINATDPGGTGPLGFLRRNRDAAIDAAFDDRPGNNERFAAALDRYDRSVQVAVLTGQVLVITGQLINSAIPGQGPRGSFAGTIGRGVGRHAARLATKRGSVQLGGWSNSARFTTTPSTGFSTLARSNPYARTGANTAAQAIRVQPKIRPPVPVEEFDAVAALCTFL
ncbi:RHS repeat-associated core domain-containing protein [Methanothrix soehngenii]|uniref:RHS repeat-associated core domain-containing protein n=1 Tax=Methanothrix soehngenii TaxID=2223 RepID=UPI00300C44AA